MHALLRAVKAPATEIAELKKLYDTQRMSGVAPAKVISGQVEAPAVEKPKLSLTLDRPVQDATTAKALRPWFEVALPHPDVLANRFKEAEFAADLFAVIQAMLTQRTTAPPPRAFLRLHF